MYLGLGLAERYSHSLEFPRERTLLLADFGRCSTGNIVMIRGDDMKSFIDRVLEIIKNKPAIVTTLIAIVITMLYQFNISLRVFYVNGYTGGMQSIRSPAGNCDYSPFIVLGAAALVFVSDENGTLHISRLGALFCAGFVMMPVWDGLLQLFLLQLVGLAARG